MISIYLSKLVLSHCDLYISVVQKVIGTFILNKKMSTNFLGVLIIFLLVSQEIHGDGPASFPIEEGCRPTGGICMPTDECPSDIETKGLCPNANKKDPSVECCLGISLKETRCQRLGGECQSKCHNDNMKIPRAQDCTSDTVCCVLF
ncbi:hypothetical protein ILUMI_27109 [Ignelater luminosus]|uniref:Uncharacterized protein n=1 Tax=Ignelater luminosus TaxID=2038154 RepID=A0A8K0C5K7_IGNLU|nr:hypothetical protein ILUMI_27109 [Ignelater luminosus]